jgi:hypothetical protein
MPSSETRNKNVRFSYQSELGERIREVSLQFLKVILQRAKAKNLVIHVIKFQQFMIYD